MVVLFVERSRTSPDLYHRHPREGNPERSDAPEIQQESPERVVEPDHDEPVGSEDPAEVLKPSERVAGVVQDPVGEAASHTERCGQLIQRPHHQRRTTSGACDRVAWRRLATLPGVQEGLDHGVGGFRVPGPRADRERDEVPLAVLSPWSRPSGPIPSSCGRDCPRKPGSAWGGTRDRAATRRKTGSPSTPSTWKSTPSRSTPMWPPGARARAGLLEGRQLGVEGAKHRLHDEDASFGPFEVVEGTAPDTEVETRPAVHHRHPAPLGIDAPLHDHGAVGIDGDIDELEGAEAEADRAAPFTRDVADGGDGLLRRQRGATGERDGDQHGQPGVPRRSERDQRAGLCQMTWPTKKGPRLAMYSEVWTAFRMAWTRCESGWSSLPTRPMRKSLSWTSRPLHTSRMSCARSASP